MKTLITKRKFYNKWSYKISLQIKHCAKLRTKSLEEIIQNDTDGILVKFCNHIIIFSKQDYATRIERDVLDFYTNSNDIFNSTVEKFSAIVKRISTPHPGTENLLEDAKSIICNKLPHGKYRFKVFLQPHKFSSLEDKTRYLGWLDTQYPRIGISEKVKAWFMVTNWNWDRRYIWVEDSATLLLLKMRNVEAIGSTYNYVLSDK